MNKHLSEWRFEIGSGIANQLKTSIDTDSYTNVFLLTDENVYDIYNNLISELFRDELQNNRYYIIPAGESSKSLDIVSKIIEQMLLSGLDRNSLLCSLGGGVVTDIGGLVATLFMRGIGFINIPTTLVGQIDASIGGKCGVNHELAKNIIGAFTRPEMVLIDLNFLNTLPKEEIKNGMAELLKIALIADGYLFNKLKMIRCEIKDLDIDEKENIIKQSAQLKLKIVANDFKEKGYRRILNFGHTAGHAVETLNEYRNYSHGQAVLIGMLTAIQLSVDIVGFDKQLKEVVFNMIETLLSTNDLSKLNTAKLWDKLQYDKKKRTGQILFILLKDIGEPVIQAVSKKQFYTAFESIKNGLNR